MRIAIYFSCALLSAGAAAQGSGDAMEKLRACLTLAQPERIECLETLSRDLAPPPPPAATQERMSADWIVSETTSPIDYSPVVVATASSGGGDGPSMQLSIQCRGGRTELVIGSQTLARHAEAYAVSYSVNDGPPVPVAVGASASGAGIAVKGDVVRLLASLPSQGSVTFRANAQQGTILEGRYALNRLKAVMDRITGPCKWPAAPVTRP
jgi:hypothetical protein